MMADLPMDFWAGWIAVITVAGLVALLWLVYSVYFSPNGHADEESPVWDETLREGSHPAPMWWFWLILATMIFSVIYLMLYPGLGSYSGALRWSQGGRVVESFTAYDAEFGDLRRLVLSAPVETLHDDERVMDSAERVFEQNCAACHGPAGEGQAASFPNIVDDDWQWGGTPEQIEQTLRAGRQAVMPPLAAVLDEATIAQIAGHVVAMQSGADVAAGDPGQTGFATYCSACHGADGTGNPLLGAPNIVDAITVYGDSLEDISATIANGRFGIMPSFAGRLDDVQIHMLVAWLTRDATP